MVDNFIKYKQCFLYDAFNGSTLSSLKRPLLGCKDWNDKVDTLHEKFEAMDHISEDNLPLRNFLENRGASYKGTFPFSCQYIYAAYSKSFKQYPNVADVKNSVLANEKITQAIEDTLQQSQDESKPEQIDKTKARLKLMKQASTMLHKMQATVTSKCLRFCSWLFMTLLKKLCSSVTLHQGQIKVVRQMIEENRPVIFVPLHYSHFDYILLSVLAFDYEMNAPFVASGNNLDLPIFSYVIKRLGGFFIRRKIDSGDKKDLLYRAVLHSYVTELLKRKQVMEIFIEGTRSRSGMPTKPMTGILSIAVDAVDSGVIDDATIIPVNISYEKLIDGDFHKEMMGEAKRPETFFGTIRTTFRILLSYFGHIRINFGVPKSLKNTLHELRTSPNLGFGDSLSNLALDKNEVSDKKSDTNRVLIPLLAEHLIYRSIQSRVLMSTNIVAFLLVHRYRCGVSLPVLVVAFEELVKQLLDRKWDVGFSGSCYEVVLHALNLLGPELIKTYQADPNNNTDATKEKLGLEPIDSDKKSSERLKLAAAAGEGESQMPPHSGFVTNISNGNLKIELSNSCDSTSSGNDDDLQYTTIVPNLTPPYAYELAYYGNALAPVYALESLAALTVGAVLDCRFSDVQLEFICSGGNEQVINHIAPLHSINSNQLPSSMMMEFSRSKLISHTLELTDILRFDLILCDVVEDIELCVFEAVESLISQNLLIGNTTRKSNARKKNNYDDIDYGDDDEKEDEQMLHVNIGAIHDFIAKQSILGSFIEGYVVAASELNILLDGAVEERSFQKKVLKTAQERVTKGIANRPESSSSDIIRHAISSFETNGMIRRCKQDKKMLELTSNFNTIELIADYVCYISQYLM